MCCHPALEPQARIALTLRCVCGLPTAEIAAAFLVPEATMAKRLTRAKNKVRDSGLALAMPRAELLQTRTADVLKVLYLIFSEGHQASSGEDLLRPDLCVAGVNLARGLAARLPRDPEVLGLLALLLLRTTAPAELVLVGARPARSAFGPGCGATRVVAADDEAALARLAGRLDAAVEASNAPAGAATAVSLLRRGGGAVLLGISGARRPAIDPDTVTLNQLRLQGGFAASRNAWRWVVGLYADGLLDPAPLVTHHVPLAEVDGAFAALTAADGGAVKILVHP
jgi:hypothetical protein